MSLQLRADARRGGVALLLTAGLVAGLAGCGLGGHTGGTGSGGGTTNGSAAGHGAAGGASAGAAGGSSAAGGGTTGAPAGSSGASSSPAATDVDGLQQAVDQAGSLADQVDQDMAGDASS